MSTDTEQDTPTSTLADRLSRAAVAFHESGVIDDPHQMLADINNSDKLNELVASGTDEEREYALTAMAFQKESNLLAAAVSSPAEADVAYVAGPIPEAEDAGPVASPAPTAAPEAPVAAIPEASEEMSEEDKLFASLDARVQSVLRWLSHTPVLLLGMRGAASVNFRVPAVGTKMRATDAQGAVVKYVLAPIMRATGIISVEIEPHVYDIVNEKRVELDMNDPRSARMWLRSVIEHNTLDPAPPPKNG